MEYQTASGKTIELIMVADHESTDLPGAEIVESVITSQEIGAPSIMFCTGSTPVPIYREMVNRYKNKGLSFKNVRAFMLDEYVGLPSGHPACFRTFMIDHLYGKVDFKRENIHYFDGPLEDHMGNCFRYEQALSAKGGIDLTLLGIGSNGHIAFNEPGTSPESRTRLIKLTDETRKANARFFLTPEEVPTHALSVGLANILESKAVALFAAGSKKSEIIARALAGPVTNDIPASHLQNFQGKLTVILDEAAAAGLNR